MKKLPACKRMAIVSIVLLLCVCSISSFAQLSVGLEGGYTRNYLETNNANRDFTNYRPGNDFSAGIPVQYKIASWFAIAADPSFIRKTYVQERSGFYAGTYEISNNSYLQLPLMGHFMFGGKKLQGFFNLGAFAGYWLTGHVSGRLPNVLNPVDSVTASNTFYYYSNSYSYNEKYAFDTRRDNRIEAGWIAGAGLSYAITQKFSVYAEGRLMQSVTDMQKNYMLNQIPRYNQTYNANLGIMMSLEKKQLTINNNYTNEFIMKRKSYILPLLLMVLIISSCTKNIENVNRPENYVDGTFNEVFQAYWNGMNNNYIFWDIDTTDWDGMYRRYQPVFAKLNVNDSNDVRKSIGYFRQMTQGLVDSHYNLSFGYSSVADSSVNPAYSRKKNSIHPFVFYANYAAGYLDNGFVYGEDTLTDPSQYRFAIAGTINKDILYFSCYIFGLKSSYDADNNNGIKKVLNYLFAKLANPTGIKGVIIDVRGNPGGEVNDLNFLLGRMVSSPLTFGYTRYKSGNGRLDYTPWAPAIITPQPGSKGLNIPVIALADAWSVSLAELTTMAIHTMPNGKFIGETTWGANGPLSPNENFNGGQFTAANFLFAYTSSSEFKYLDNNIYEGKGFPPDITVPYNQTYLNQGRDAALEAAITAILQ